MRFFKGFPFVFIAFCYLGYLGFDTYQAMRGSRGLVQMFRGLVQTQEERSRSLDVKLAELKENLKSHEEKKEELGHIRELIGGMMTDPLDTAGLIKTLYTEAKKIGLKVEKIEPGTRDAEDVYIEQAFTVKVRGSYSQLVDFSMRLAQVQRLMILEGFTIVPLESVGGVGHTLATADLVVRAYQPQSQLQKEDGT